MDATPSDAKRRSKYIGTITKATLMLTKYDYVEGSVLLRITAKVAPPDAKRYERAFGAVVGDQPTSVGARGNRRHLLLFVQCDEQRFDAPLKNKPVHLVRERQSQAFRATPL